MSKDKDRKLTKKEQERLIHFNKYADELINQGYKKIDLTMSVLKANLGSIYGILLSIPFIIIFIITSKNKMVSYDNFSKHLLIFYVVFIILVVVHELIHGITWSIFAKKHFKSIDFGIIWKMLTPYCTCNEALKKNQYLLGCLMPCIVLGIIPCVISFFNHNIWFLYMGVIMIITAGGDLMIAKSIITNSFNDNALFIDHPSDPGLVVFEK